MIQVLFSVSVEEVLRSVSWVEDDGYVRLRVIQDDGSWFERDSDYCTLTEVWRDEGLYFGYRPALVNSLDEAFGFLGSKLADIDHLPRGPLEVPRHWVIRR